MDARTAHYRDRIRQLEDEIADLKVALSETTAQLQDKQTPTPRSR